MRKFTIFLIVIFSFLTLFEMSLTSCASRSNPSGGPKDTLAPALDTAIPHNFSTHFNSKEILLVFNEYLNLRNPNQQVMISPPLSKQPKVLLRGSRILISIDDTLMKNTTYTISFGTSITDYTEGNVNRNFKYVFSTGSYIDSLNYGGTVVDAYTGEPEKDLLVALYELKGDITDIDSIPYRRIPTYYSYLDENGHFTLENMKYGAFKIMAFEDKRNIFLPDATTKKIAFSKDTIYTSVEFEPVVLRSFTPEPEFRYYGARHAGRGKVQFNFNKKVMDVEVNRLYPPISDAEHFLTYNTKRDTSIFWFSDSIITDSVVFAVSHSSGLKDTSSFFPREYKTPRLNLSIRNTQWRIQDSIKVYANLPIQKLDTSLISAYTATDTLNVIAIAEDPPLEFYLVPEERPKSFTLQILPGAAQAWYNRTNDTLSTVIKMLGREDLGSLEFTVTTDTSAIYILEIYDARNNVIYRESFLDSVQVHLRNLVPGKYEALLIEDRNDDGEWTSGSYFEGRQPERIHHYTEPIDIRANWDLEMEWKLRF